MRITDINKKIEDQICTKEHPDCNAKIHPEAEPYGDDDYYDRYHCPNCDIRIKVEVPE